MLPSASEAWNRSLSPLVDNEQDGSLVRGGRGGLRPRPRPLPPRYYIPPEDVREEVLVESETTTRCPYKGVASYYSVEAGGERVEDLAWYYPEPIPEAPKIRGLLCFFNEKVDLEVDGEEQLRPETQWS